MFTNHINVLVFSIGHNGVTALALPAQSQYPNFGNAMEVSNDKSAHLAAQQHIPIDHWNVSISPEENGIATVELLVQSHGIDLQCAND